MGSLLQVVFSKQFYPIEASPLNAILDRCGPAYVRSYEPLKIDCKGIMLSPLFTTVPERDKLIIGIRPEGIRISLERPEKGIEVSVSIIEPAGSFNWVNVIWNDVNIKGISELNQELKVRDKAFIEFREDKVIVFDEETGRRL